MNDSNKTGSIAKKEDNPVAAFSNFLGRYRGQIEKALPKHLSADRMCRLALTAFSGNPALQACTRDSIIAAVVMSSQMGLEIGVNGQAYIIPYKGRATFVPGWKGLVDLCNRAGRASVWTGAVFVGDEFDYGYGDRPFITHKPCGEDDPDKLLYVYAVGRVKNSEWPIIEVWSSARIWRHRDKMNKVGNRHYSFAHEEMYARKIPLLQVLKYMPSSIELSNAISANDAAEMGASASMDGDVVFVEQVAEEPTQDRPDPVAPRRSQPAASQTSAPADAQTDGARAPWDSEDVPGLNVSPKQSDEPATRGECQLILAKIKNARLDVFDVLDACGVKDLADPLTLQGLKAGDASKLLTHLK